jgi:hypothetical protein
MALAAGGGGGGGEGEGGGGERSRRTISFSVAVVFKVFSKITYLYNINIDQLIQYIIQNMTNYEPIKIKDRVHEN